MRSNATYIGLAAVAPCVGVEISRSRRYTRWSEEGWTFFIWKRLI